MDYSKLDSEILALLPAEVDGDDTGTVGGDSEEHRHGEIEVEAGRVTPAAIVVGQGEVGRAEVSGGDHNRRVSGEARSVFAAFDLEACPAAQPAVEQRRAQRRIVNPIPLRVQIPLEPYESQSGATGTRSAIPEESTAAVALSHGKSVPETGQELAPGNRHFCDRHPGSPQFLPTKRNSHCIATATGLVAFSTDRENNRIVSPSSSMAMADHSTSRSLECGQNPKLRLL
nr:hypothetical protein Iba_chr05bCG4860 [Ipomoea batatas]